MDKMKPAILITVISSLVATAIGRSVYISGPSNDLHHHGSSAFIGIPSIRDSYISTGSRSRGSYSIPLIISSESRYNRQSPFGLGLQSTFNGLQRPPYYPHDHHAFPSRRRLDHAVGGDFFGRRHRHRHTLHSEREDRREASRRRRRLRRLLQRHREAEKKGAVKGHRHRH